MTWLLLLAWVNDPARTVTQLQTACTDLGLPPTGNRTQLTTKLRNHIAAQPDLTATSAYAPTGWTPPAPPPPVTTPTPLPAPIPAPAVVTVNNQNWLWPFAVVALGIMALIAVMAWSPWDNNDSSNDASVITTTTMVTTTTVSPTTTTVMPATAPTTTVTTATPNDTPTAVDTGTMPPAINTYEVGTWTIDEIDLGNDPIVANWMNNLSDPDPSVWKTFPNIPNPDVSEFDVANGMEYGVDNVPFCQQDSRCDFVVPAWHYRLITADYSFKGMTCQGADGNGCLLLLINVGDQSFTWRDQMADNGFSVAGRYWNGDRLDEGVWGLVSHASANMLGMPTMAHPNEVLNSGMPANAGSNCSTPYACNEVDVTVVITAGDRILAVATTTVTR